MPLIHATALGLWKGQLLAGTNSGEVHLYDALTREPQSMATSARKGIVSAVSGSEHGIAWIVGNRTTAIRDRFASPGVAIEQSLVLRTPDGRIYVVDLKPAGVTKQIREIAWVGPRIWMLTDFGAAFYNAKTNAVEIGESFLPRSLAAEFERSHLWVRGPHIMAARPVSMRRNPKSTGLPYVSQFTVYRVTDNRWQKMGGLASNALDVEPEGELMVLADGKIPPDAPFQTLSATVDLDGTGLMAIEGANVLQAPVFSPNWETKRTELPTWFAQDARPDPLWVQVAGDNFWVWNGSILLSTSRTKTESSAFVPWNDPQAIPNAFLADDSGVWIATNVGVKRIQLDSPERMTGYGGFLRVPMGPLSEKPSGGLADKLLREVYRWRFAPEDVAGKDGGKFISQAFRAIGVELPATASGIVGAAVGTPVHDELRIGDVISSSKGLALYIGNGKTAEMSEGSVKNGFVFDRRFAVVRRFLK